MPIRTSVEMKAQFEKGRNDIAQYLRQQVYAANVTWENALTGLIEFTKLNIEYLQDDIKEKDEEENNAQEDNIPAIYQARIAGKTTVALLSIFRNSADAPQDFAADISKGVWDPEQILAPEVKNEYFQATHYNPQSRRFKSANSQKDGELLCKYLCSAQVLVTLAENLTLTLQYKNTLQPGHPDYAILNAYSAEWLNAQCETLKKASMDCHIIATDPTYRGDHISYIAIKNQNAGSFFVSPLSRISPKPGTAWQLLWLENQRFSPIPRRFAFQRLETLFSHHHRSFPYMDFSQTTSNWLTRSLAQLTYMLHIPVIILLFNQVLEKAQAARRANRLSNLLRNLSKMIFFAAIAPLLSIAIIVMGVTSLPFRVLTSVVNSVTPQRYAFMINSFFDEFEIFKDLAVIGALVIAAANPLAAFAVANVAWLPVVPFAVAAAVYVVSEGLVPLLYRISGFFNQEPALENFVGGVDIEDAVEDVIEVAPAPNHNLHIDHEVEVPHPALNIGVNGPFYALHQNLLAIQQLMHQHQQVQLDDLDDYQGPLLHW